MHPVLKLKVSFFCPMVLCVLVEIQVRHVNHDISRCVAMLFIGWANNAVPVYNVNDCPNCTLETANFRQVIHVLYCHPCPNTYVRVVDMVSSVKVTSYGMVLSASLKLVCVKPTVQLCNRNLVVL